MNTAYFGNCIGVFQGGGVRGAAFAGAYEAAHRAGVVFSSVAGASAGALAASLIATGAPPSAITTELMALDFKRFLRPVDRGQKFDDQSVFLRLGRLVRVAQKLIRIATYGGLYSSVEIRSWVEDTLRKLLAAAGRPVDDVSVRFRHLQIPLAVVAADLAKNSYKVFSTERTPDDSVALAVQASCTIPLFFQPVLEGGAVYVDGGVLSNLPAFMFSDIINLDYSKYSPRVLAFMLTNDSVPRTKIATVQSFGEGLANTIVGGATDIQRKLQPGFYAIAIDTGPIKATDFGGVGAKEKKELFAAGHNATENFLTNERNLFFERRRPTTFVGRDQQMLLYVQSLAEAIDKFVILDKSSKWLYLIFPAFFAAARRGVRIYYISTRNLNPSGEEGRHEAYRRRLLKGLGGEIQEHDKLPFRGFIVDPERDTGFAALTHESRSSEDLYQTEETRTYSRGLDPEVFQFLSDGARALLVGAAAQPAQPVNMEACDEGLLLRRLKSVSQYREATFAIRDVPLVKGELAIRATQRWVKEFKYFQIDVLTRQFLAAGVRPFDVQQIRLGNGMSTIVTPPVLEKHGSYLNLVEGHSRTLYAVRHGMEAIRAVIVEGVTAPLPAQPRPIADLTISSKTLSWHVQYESLSKPDWRSIEEHVHSVADGEPQGTAS